MKRIIIGIVLAPALIIGACDSQGTVEPASDTQAVVLQKTDDASVQDGRLDARDRYGLDLEAFQYYRLILAANPDLSERVKAALLKLIRESQQKRQRVLSASLFDSRERLAKWLQAEHEALIAAMNALLTREQIAKTLLLKQRLDRRRDIRTDRG